MSGSNHVPRNESRRTPAMAVSSRENARAIHRAGLRLPPAASTVTNPAKGTMRRRERKSIRSWPPEDAGQEPEDDREDEDRGDPEDDHPRVVLDLSGLAGPEGQARSKGLEADAVHGAVDDLPIEEVREGSQRDRPPTDRVHDSVDNVSIEPVHGLREARNDVGPECVVLFVDPVPIQ